MLNNQHHHQAISDSKCIKCRYEKLYVVGKKIFNEWDKTSPVPPRLVAIKKELTKLQKTINGNKANSELEFCANHPEIFEFLPWEIL